jgi:cysteine desulfurase
VRTPIYLDNHATTPVDPRVLEAMLPFFSGAFGNAASRGHRFGWEAEKAVELARKRVAALAGAAPREIVFTSGATESDNLALKGAWEAYGARGNHIVTMLAEHKAVHDPLVRLQVRGAELTVLPCRPDGLLDPDSLRDAIRPETILVSVMYANNEIGVVQPVREIGAICHETGALFHCDAAQAFGKVPIDVNRDGIDLMSLSAHKMYGPKGVGALYVRRRDPRVSLQAQMDGGGHEFGMRSGTLNVPGIVGFGAACEICGAEMETESARLLGLRERLRAALESAPGGRINGSLEHRLPGNLNMAFMGVDAEALLMAMPEIAASTGAACSSATVHPSHVLRALGIGDEAARSSVRFGLGRFNTEEEIDYTAGRVAEAAAKLRRLA